MLDASALLAFLNDEPGAARVPATSGDAVMSSVNWAEVVSVLTSRGFDEDTIRRNLSRLAIEVIGFDGEQAERAGFLLAATKAKGLSLGDRACLSAALSSGLTVITADRAWGALSLGVKIDLIR